MDFTKQAHLQDRVLPVSELGKLESEGQTVHIPICCREGWPSCPHVPKKQKVAKKNIGL